MNRRFDTPCKNCIFAIYDNITQTGCKFNRLDIFRDKECGVIEAYDHEKEFFVIKNRLCLYKRTEKWPYHDAEEKKQVTQIQKEIRLQYKAIVYHNDNLDDLKKTLTSLLNQTLRPTSLAVIKRVDSKEHRAYLLELLKHVNIPWRIENITNNDVSYWQAVDFAVMHKPNNYYAVFNAGCDIPKDTFEIINHKMVEELKPIAIVKPNSNGDGLISSHVIHMATEDFRSRGVLENMKERLPLFPCITELCPNFPN